jgi:hypothetical protein
VIYWGFPKSLRKLGAGVSKMGYAAALMREVGVSDWTFP